MTTLRVAVVGAGAVGGYYGALLSRAGHEVSMVARGPHLKALHERGMMVWSPLGDFVTRPAAVADPAAIGIVDLVLFAVKTYANRSALPLLAPLVGPATTVLTGPTYIATALAGPGFIEQTGTHRRVVFGEAFAQAEAPSPRVAALADVLTAAHVQAEPVGDARLPLWEKFIYLAPFASVTGAARRPAGVVWGDPELRALFLRAVRETEAVAHAAGVPVSGETVPRIERYMEALPASTRSSLLIDLESGKPIENEALAGEVVRLGRAHGVATPAMETLYAVLRPWTDGR